MKKYYLLGRAFIRNKSQNDIAYLGNFWAELLSTVFYILTFIVFAQLLFLRIKTFGGYSKDDFLFMTLIGQITFYVWANIFLAPMVLLVDNVRTGNFDYLLVRPVSAKFYTYISGIRPVIGIFVGLPNVLLVCFIINWSNINITLLSIFMGVVVWLCSMTILSTVMFALTMPVFTQGDSSDMLNSSYSLMGVSAMPYNLLPKWLKLSSFVFIPTILATSGGSFVMLQKGGVWYIILAAILAALLSLVCFNILWKRSMNSYSSASS